MSSAVQSLQKSILNGQKSITQLLRETKLIAAQLRLEDVEKWVDFELNGYPHNVEPPEYRHYNISSLQVHHPQYGWQFAGNLDLRSKAGKPIAEIEHLSHGENLATTLARQLPMSESIASDWPQRGIVAASEFKHILEAVKNRLLDWTIELDKRGIKGEDMNFDDKEKQAALGQVFHIQKFTGVLGNVTNSQVTLYDYGTVNQLLLDHKVPKDARREFEDIVDELKNATPDKKPSLIAKGEQWIVKHKDFLGATGEIVAQVIKAAT